MALRMTATSVTEIGDGIWGFEMPPHQARHFNGNACAIGTKSILLFSGFEYDREARILQFDMDSVTALNIGTTTTTIGIASNSAEAEPSENLTSERIPLTAKGPGDRAFLRMCNEELTPETANAAELLLEGVRKKSVGDLKRGQSRNFSETPDNFWYTIVQPRIDELSITVRGPVSHFEKIAKLEIKDDRGNTRFKVRGKSDVEAALQLIFHAIRKK